MEIRSSNFSTTSSAGTGFSNLKQDFETFLRMLTTQIQNQDPLSPMDAENFATQLASFSMVEQQTLTNQLLENLSLQSAERDMVRYVDLIGSTVGHSNDFWMSGEEVEFHFASARADVPVIMAIISTNGDIVAELPISQGQEKVGWDGLSIDGLPASSGYYQAELRRVSDGVVVPNGVVTEAVVEEVRFAEDGVELLLSDGTKITEAEVRTLR